MNSRHTKRAWWHDYYSKSIYFITLNKLDGIPDFGFLIGNCNASKESRPHKFGRLFSKHCNILLALLRLTPGPKSTPSSYSYSYSFFFPSSSFLFLFFFPFLLFGSDVGVRR